MCFLPSPGECKGTYHPAMASIAATAMGVPPSPWLRCLPSLRPGVSTIAVASTPRVCLVRKVPRICAHGVGRGNAIIIYHHVHTEIGMLKIVAVEHPQTRIVGQKRNVPCFMGANKNS